MYKGNRKLFLNIQELSESRTYEASLKKRKTDEILIIKEQIKNIELRNGKDKVKEQAVIVGSIYISI